MIVCIIVCDCTRSLVQRRIFPRVNRVRCTEAVAVSLHAVVDVNPSQPWKTHEYTPSHGSGIIRDVANVSRKGTSEDDRDPSSRLATR